VQRCCLQLAGSYHVFFSVFFDYGAIATTGNRSRIRGKPTVFVHEAISCVCVGEEGWSDVVLLLSEGGRETERPRENGPTYIQRNKDHVTRPFQFLNPSS
jgi:hypothetical protein